MMWCDVMWLAKEIQSKINMQAERERKKEQKRVKIQKRKSQNEHAIGICNVNKFKLIMVIAIGWLVNAMVFAFWLHRRKKERKKGKSKRAAFICEYSIKFANNISFDNLIIVVLCGFFHCSKRHSPWTFKRWLFFLSSSKW